MNVKGGHVPGRRAALDLGEHKQPPVAAHELAERRQLLPPMQSRHEPVQAGVREGGRDRLRRHVVLDDHHEDLAGMPLQEAPDHLEFLPERLRTELAERVAQVQLRRAAELSRADPSRDAVGHLQRQRRDLLGALVAIGSLRPQVRAHAPGRRVVDAVVDVDEQRPDPVLQLILDPPALVREVPPGLFGRGERVVSSGKHDLV